MPSDAWKARIAKALADGGCASPAEWVKSKPGEHCWFQFRNDDFNSCVCCGTVQRRDNKNKPCQGFVTLRLRG